MCGPWRVGSSQACRFVRQSLLACWPCTKLDAYVLRSTFHSADVMCIVHACQSLIAQYWRHMQLCTNSGLSCSLALCAHQHSWLAHIQSWLWLVCLGLAGELS